MSYVIQNGEEFIGVSWRNPGASGRAYLGEDVQDILFDGCVIEGFREQIRLVRCLRVTIRRCEFIDAVGTESGSGYSILAANSKWITIEDCIFSSAPGTGRHFVYLNSGSQLCTVRKNKMYGGHQAQIALYSQDHQRETSDNSITENSLSLMDSAVSATGAIVVTGKCHRNTFTENQIFSPTPRGALFQAGADENVFSYNTIVNPSVACITVTDSSITQEGNSCL